MPGLTTMEKYKYLKSLVTGDRKEQFNKLMDTIETETVYLRCPASTKYHGCHNGGLLEHLVSVGFTMIKIKRTLAPEISDDSCVIVALLHDLGKAGYPGAPNYIVNTNYNRNKPISNYNAPYTYNTDIVEMPHAHRSVYLVQNMGFQLTPEEFQAIISHDGQYIQDNKSYALKECKLATLLHYADLWSSQYLE